MSRERASGAATVRVNGEVLRWRPGVVRDLLARRGIAVGAPGIAVAVNGRVLTRAEWATRSVRAGDVIEIVGAVQGG